MRAHFAICYAAFFAMRLMRSDLHWRYNAAQVADSLIRMEGGYLAENWFLFGYRSPVSDAIEQAAGVDAAQRLRTRQDIRKGIAQARAHIRKNPREKKARRMGRQNREARQLVTCSFPSGFPRTKNATPCKDAALLFLKEGSLKAQSLFKKTHGEKREPSPLHHSE
ncbi:MAG: hypothetical protein ACLT98_01735 [Eggerthellaceae bacterium]